MKSTKFAMFLTLVGCVGLLAFIVAKGHSNDRSPEPYGQEIGTVHLPSSYGAAVDAHLKRGLALLHHMTYEDAREEFAAAFEENANCSLALWGQAMTFIHPLWSDPPNKEEFAAGKDLIAKAKALNPKATIEQAYIQAVDSYYAAGQSAEEMPNLAAFEEGWNNAYHEFPDDLEVACFYALAHMAIADPADKTYARQRRAGAVAEAVLEEEPNHPGGHHYTIHAYDYPELAHLALDVARSYGNIAPEIPHALHMPTHIFTRLGLWQDSITMNLRSAAAAVKHPVDGSISLHYPHALDYLAYAYLQLGDDTNAERIQDQLISKEGPYQEHVAAAYALAAVPARLALERRHWADAASIQPREPGKYPWDRFPAMEAISHFATALWIRSFGRVHKGRL